MVHVVQRQQHRGAVEERVAVGAVEALLQIAGVEVAPQSWLHEEVQHLLACDKAKDSSVGRSTPRNAINHRCPFWENRWVSLVVD